MTRNIKNILLIFLIIILTFLLKSNISHAAETIKTVTPEYFNTKTLAKIIGNTSLSTSYSGIGTYICSGRAEIKTLLDNKNNLNFVYFDNDNVYIQKLDSNNKEDTLLTIKKRYPVYGNIIIDKNGYYYISWGQNDTTPYSNKEEVITFEIAKYDNNGNFIAAFDKSNSGSGGATNMIFDIGTCNMDINSKGILAYDYTHKMKNGHQSNVTGYVDTSTMEMADETYRTYPYTSHCMKSVVTALSTDEFLFTDQGDFGNRGITYTLISDKLAYSKKSKLNSNRLTFHFREGAARAYGYNYTFAKLGNVIELDTGFALIANSENTLSLNPAPNLSENESRNIFVQIIKRDSFLKENRTTAVASDYVTQGVRNSTGIEQKSDEANAILYVNKQGITDYGVKWLTNYSGKYTAIDIGAVKVDNDRIAILWDQDNYNVEPTTRNVTYYMVIDNKGNIVQDKILIEQGRTPMDAQPVYKDGYLYFTNSDGSNNIKTYRVKLYQYENKIDPVYPESITVDIAQYKNLVGSTVQLNLTYNPTNTTEKNVTWSSSNNEVATVTQNGLVTITGEGDAVITATIPSGKTATCKVTGLSKNASIMFDKSIYIAYTDNSVKLNLSKKIKELSGKEIDTSKIRFSLSDNNAGTIDESNIFIPSENYKDKLIGVTADYLGNKATAQIRIIANGSLNPSFKLKAENDETIKNGESKKIILYQEDKQTDIYFNKFEVDINYDAANLEVEKTEILLDGLEITSIENGKIHLLCDKGEDVIQINNTEFIAITFKCVTNAETTNEVTGTDWMFKTFPISNYNNRGNTWKSATIKTQQVIPLNSISLNKTKIELIEGDEETLKVTFNPTNTTENKTITWTSSNKSVATIDKNGKIKAIKEGTVTITANVLGQEASCSVTVNEKPKPQYNLGDVNKDGKINSLDAVEILKYVAKKKTLTEEQLTLADTTRDNKVNSLDAVRILKYVAKKITEI